MRLNARLARVEKSLRGRPQPGQFYIIEVVPVGREAAEGRGPGLYRDGPEGSMAGVLVFDPARGEPAVPEGRLAPHGLVIRCVYPEEEAAPPGRPA